MYANVAKFIDDNLDNSVEALKILVRIPTVAAKGQGLPETADLFGKMLQDAGLSASSSNPPE